MLERMSNMMNLNGFSLQMLKRVNILRDLRLEESRLLNGESLYIKVSECMHILHLLRRN